jgi:hypothetical protein
MLPIDYYVQYNRGLISEVCSDMLLGLLGLGVRLAARQSEFSPE